MGSDPIRLISVDPWVKSATSLRVYDDAHYQRGCWYLHDR